MKNPNVPFEVRIQHRKLVHRNIEYGGILHDGVVFVAESIVLCSALIDGVDYLTK